MSTVVDLNDFEKLENALERAGKAIPYPATPALAAGVSARLEMDNTPRARRRPRLAFVLGAALLLALVLLIAFPETREALAQFLGLRTVRIIPLLETPTPSPTADLTPGETPVLTPTPSAAIQCCETTLAEAQARSKFRLLLPPLERPPRVYLQEIPNFGPGAQQVILVFGDPNAPTFTLFEAHQFLYGKVLGQFGKGVGSGTLVEETQVRGTRGLWFSGAPHILVYLDAQGRPIIGAERPVNANTLAWEAGTDINAVTYRLETNQNLEEAKRFAESLK